MHSKIQPRLIQKAKRPCINDTETKSVRLRVTTLLYPFLTKKTSVGMAKQPVLRLTDASDAPLESSL